MYVSSENLLHFRSRDHFFWSKESMIYNLRDFASLSFGLNATNYFFLCTLTSLSLFIVDLK